MTHLCIQSGNRHTQPYAETCLSVVDRYKYQWMGRKMKDQNKSSKIIDTVSYTWYMGINGCLYLILGEKTHLNWIVCTSVHIHVFTQKA